MYRKKTERLHIKMLTTVIPGKVMGGLIFFLKTNRKLNCILSADFKETRDEKYRN